MTLESWRYRDPALVIEEQEQQDIKRDERMGQNLKSVPAYVQRDMYRWGDWARRPQFWENLNITPFCKLLGLHVGGHLPNIRLDAQSMAIHKAVMSLDDQHKMVLAAYYVFNYQHEDKPDIFNGHGISRATYYRKLTSGSIGAHNRGMHILERAKLGL